MPTKNITDNMIVRAVEIYVDELRPIKDVVSFLDCAAPTATKLLIKAGVTIRSRGRIKKSIKKAEDTVVDLSGVESLVPVDNIESIDTSKEDGWSSDLIEKRDRILREHARGSRERYNVG